MASLLATETLFIELLLVLSLVSVGARRLRLPYTVALVVVGLLISVQESVRFHLTPELIMALFVPPIAFEAAFHIDISSLRRSLLPVLVLAVPGVVLSALLIGGMVALGTGLSLPTALLFGTLISATDPVAVSSLFRALGSPRQLSVMVESESLLNDGTAIILFSLLMTAAVGTSPASGTPIIVSTAVSFLVVSVGGLALGVGLGWLVSQVIARLDDYLVEITLTTVLAFGAYLIAERLNVSGVLAVVGAGLVSGNIGPRGMSPTTRIVLFNFWEYLAFLANSLVFLLIGLDVNIGRLIDNAVPVVVAVVAVLISRAVTVYGLASLVNLRRYRLPTAYQHVLFWGGLRGAVSLALALSLPNSLAQSDMLRTMAFGAVLFTLIVQGTTTGPLLRRLHLTHTSAQRLRHERQHARLLAARAAKSHLDRLHTDGVVSDLTWEYMRDELDRRIQSRLVEQSALLEEYPALLDEERQHALQEALRMQRATLGNLLRDGVIGEEVYNELTSEVDVGLQAAAHRPNDTGAPEAMDQAREQLL